MKSIFKRIPALFMSAVLGAALFPGCAFFQFKDYTSDLFEEEYVEPDYDFTVSCTETETTIVLGNVGYYGDTAELVYVKPYEYLSGESITGLSEDKNVNPTCIAEYECGTEATITIDRYDKNDYDTVYCKFYVVDEDSEILAGPIYASEIQPVYDHDEVVKVNGIKGVATGGETYNEVLDLGCEHVQLGMMLTGMIVPLETVDETTGEITPIEYEEHLDADGKGYIIGPYNEPQYVEAFWHNGKKFYFRTAAWRGYSGFDYWDYEISRYTRAGVKVTIILLMGMQLDQYIQPYFITYKEARHKPAGYYAVNTANEYGAEYWMAFTEFTARRYSQEDSAKDAVHGTVESYILSNEIDQCAQWNCMADYDKYARLDTEEYMEEYERMLHITNQSFKTIYSRNIALVPITHWWTSNGGGSDYNPKDIVDALCLMTRKRGNYNWGLAIHPYGCVLSAPSFWNSDLTPSYGINGTFETKQITYMNLEVLQLYLEQDIKRCNGEVRDVYVTEGGVSSSNTVDGVMTGNDKREQAAGIAYAYYKCTQLPCIKALNYYKLIDSPEENAYFGLMSPYPNPVPKPSYYVYKDIDTENTWNATEPYLPQIQWTILENGSSVSHGYGIDVGFSWHDAMNIVKSEFDWDVHWDISKIIVN